MDQCLVQPSAEKLPYAADGNNTETCRQRIRGVRDLTFCPKWDVFIKFLPLRVQGTLRQWR